MGHRFWIELAFPLSVVDSDIDGTGDHKLLRCPSINVLLDTYKDFDACGFTLPGHRIWIGLICPLHVGDPKVDWTDNHKLVSVPAAVCCLILMKSLRSAGSLY